MSKILFLCIRSKFDLLDHNLFYCDISTGQNIFSLSNSFASSFDYIIASPPCTEFTKANNRYRSIYPYQDILLFNRVFDLCKCARKGFIIENPPGRLFSFFSSLLSFRVLTYRSLLSTKEYVLYSNMLLLSSFIPRYGRPCIPRSKHIRELFTSDFISFINSFPFE